MAPTSTKPRRQLSIPTTRRDAHPRAFRALGSARPTNQEHRATPLELFIDLAYAFAATQVTAYMTHEHSLPGVIPGLLLLALLWERWTATPDWPWPRS